MHCRIVLTEADLRGLVGGSKVARTLRHKTKDAAVTIEIALEDIGLGRIEEVVHEELTRAHRLGLGS